MKNFVQPGHVVTVTASAGGVMLGELIMGATSPVFYPRHGGEGGRHLVRVRLEGVAVVAAGA
jgi:hypothetical protein